MWPAQSGHSAVIQSSFFGTLRLCAWTILWHQSEFSWRSRRGEASLPEKINRTFQWQKDNWDVWLCVVVYVNGYTQMRMCLLSNRWMRCCHIKCPDGCAGQSQRSSLTPPLHFSWRLQQHCCWWILWWDGGHIHLPVIVLLYLMLGHNGLSSNRWPSVCLYAMRWITNAFTVSVPRI